MFLSHTSSIVSLCLLLTSTVTATQWGRSYWLTQNEKELAFSLDRLSKVNTNVANNLILFIGDGMGVTTTSAARILQGQRTEGMLGEEAELSWDKFPFTGNSKTYSTNMMSADSASTATAYHCGVKTKSDVVGLDDSAAVAVCSSSQGAEVTSVLDYALIEGKSVGIVTTDSLTGASPSAAYAHSPSRDWENDSELPEDARGVCKDIARQLVEDNLDIQVLLGGGRKHFLPNTSVDPERADVNGERLDGQDLMVKWLSRQQAKGRRARLVLNQTEFDSVNVDDVDYLIGVFEPERMLEETTRRVEGGEPSIDEMVTKAIGILSRNPKGFYLFVEGGNIDKGHHYNRARYALEETLALNRAVEAALELTDSNDTLVVVSADHSHGFSFGGYSHRGNNILGLASKNSEKMVDKLGNYFTILSYGSGPGYKKAHRENLTDEMFDVDQVYMSNFPLKSGTHGAEDVQVFASGPMSHLFTGTHEQTFIAHAMSYAACLNGRGGDRCASARYSSSGVVLPSHWLLLSVIVAILNNL